MGARRLGMVDREFVCLGIAIKVMNAGKSGEESGLWGVARQSWDWVLYVFMLLVDASCSY